MKGTSYHLQATWRKKTFSELTDNEILDEGFMPRGDDERSQLAKVAHYGDFRCLLCVFSALPAAFLFSSVQRLACLPYHQFWITS